MIIDLAPENKQFFDDIYTLHASIHEHIQTFGNHIELADEPRSLQFGWICQKTGKSWFIGIAAFRKSQCWEVIKEYFYTQETRLMFVALTPEYLQRILNLKAFY
jgi:hypothetical protein